MIQDESAMKNNQLLEEVSMDPNCDEIDQLQNKHPQLPITQDVRRSTWGKYQIQAAQALAEANVEKNASSQNTANSKKKPEKINEAVLHKPNLHFRSMFSNLIWVFGFIIFVPEYGAGVVNPGAWGLFFILLAFYIVYLALGLSCNTMLDYLKKQNIQHGSQLNSQYQIVKKKSGHFTFFAECYHYQTRVRTTFVTDANGNSYAQTTTYQQKVVTHTARQQLYPSATYDDSGRLAKISPSKQVIFVHNIVDYRFKDQQSRKKYQTAWSTFKAKNRRDTHQTYRDDYVIPGLKQRLTFYIGKGPENYKIYFLVGAILGFLWPISIYIERKVCRYHVNYKKVVTIS